ncbi:carboxylesterase/lipase family protein [Aspergillus undulatus]|uniref:carboxylesterase/lipase family protein n=1 Tax=Aspergillus undulatus TaxID=1810928 RepID=UPI003CCD221D
MATFLTWSGLALALSAAVIPAHAQLYDTVIQTEYGPVQGFKYFNQSTLERNWGVSESNVAAFLSIPFAADTAYENRWKAPQPREPWNETYVADTWGPGCPTSYATDYSEDCLSVNIWTGANSSSDKLPVFIYNQGSDQPSNDPTYYGGGLARKGLVAVTFNRRDDVLGYLAHPELNAESQSENGHSSSGNYGILDFLELLNWVQRNIEQFGGDPNRVTVAGQSFGSAQVYHAVNSELFSGLFHGAIAESGLRYPRDTLLAGLATSYVTMPKALENGLNYTAWHNASSIAELRQLPLEEILIGSGDRVTDADIWWVTALSAMYPLKFKPVLDGYVLPAKYIDILQNGPANDVPLITGNTKDESGASTSTNYTAAEYKDYCTLKYGNLSAEYFTLYSGHNTTEASSAWNAAARDTSLVSSWAFGRDWIKSAASPFYTYYWDHAPPSQNQGAYHESEVFYTMDTLYANSGDHAWTEYDYEVAAKMSGYWLNFAVTGNPNSGPYGNLTHWAPVDGVRETVFHVGNAFEDTNLAKPEQVELILEYFAQQTAY